MTFCSRCGKQLVDDAHFCHNCGARTEIGIRKGVNYPPVEDLRDAFSKAGNEMDKAFTSAAQAVRDAFTNTGRTVKEACYGQTSVCPNCGDKNTPGASFCSKCGTKLP
jgi:predicted amidophosphoribosyltransferase